jgi:dihydrofolate reductase
MIIGIVAIAKNFAIGKDGKLPWHYAPDLKFFKETTTGNTVVMGRKTYESIGKPLPNRLNLVLSRTAKTDSQSGLLILKSKAAILTLASYLKSNIYIIGGAQIYTEFADVIEQWLVTEIPQTIEAADAFMPEEFLENFEIVEKRELAENLIVKTYRRKE